MANGNDSAIVENGGELNTDDYSDIKLINKIEYDSLEDTEKPLWVRLFSIIAKSSICTMDCCPK